MPEPVTHTQKLYVVFHGLIPLVEDKNGFHAILIEMSDHATIVGHWLTEVPLQKTGGGRITLTGVRAGAAGIDPSLNLVVNLPALDLDKVFGNSVCFARIDLPKPEKLYSFFTADATGRLTGTQEPSSKKYSAVQVFEYSVPGDSFDNVSLSMAGNTIWSNRAYTITRDGSKVSVLHIYNEPPGKASGQHSAAEFLKGSKLFGVDVGLAGGAPLPFPSDWQPKQSDLPPGLLVQELAPLGTRNLQVFQILDALRADGPVDGKPIASDFLCAAIFIVIGIEMWRHMHHP